MNYRTNCGTFLKGNLRALILLIAGQFSLAAYAQEEIPLDVSHLKFASDDYRIVRQAGKTSVRLIKNRMFVRDRIFQDGTIEFSALFSSMRDFIGLSFRMADSTNYEDFYIRPHQSGFPDATQYCPNDSEVTGWQLYTGAGFTSNVKFSFDAWVKFKFVISGSRMQVFIDDMKTPALVVPELKRPVRAGELSFYTTNSIAYFADIRIKDSTEPISAESTVVEVPSRVKTWLVSNSFPEEDIEKIPEVGPDWNSRFKWHVVNSESTGLVNLASTVSWTPDKNTACAKTIIYSQKEQIKKFTFGFSDRVRIYLNGKIIFSADDSFRSRDFKFMGTIGYYDHVYLHLKKGVNELQLAVSETFGGWGVQGKFDEMQGIELRSEGK